VTVAGLARIVPRRLFRRPSRWSLRARLLVLTVLLLTGALTTSNVLVLLAFRGPLVERVDHQLEAVASVAVDWPPEMVGAMQPVGNPRFGIGFDMINKLYVAYLAADGHTQTVLTGAEHAPDLPRLDAAVVTAHGGKPFAVAGRVGDPGWRVIAIKQSGPSAAGGSVVVAASLDAVDTTVAQIRDDCLVIGFVVLALLTGLGYLALRTGLRPLRSIEETSAAIARGDLTRRVPDLAPLDTEIGRLGSSLNGMLAQIESAVAARMASEARMRRFVADASHELRTPLAGITGFAELYRMGAFTSPDDVDRTMDRIERESTRLAQLVDDLLLLARLDESAGTTPPLRPEAMDLRTVAADALHDLRALDPSRSVELTGPGGGPTGGAPIMGDEASLRQVVTNLVGNVLSHTPAGSPVRLGVGTVGDRAVIEVADSGPGIGEDQAQRVFERFYRANSSRSRGSGGGAGLGLAIVKSLVSAQGGDILLETAPGKGCTFRIELPRYDDG
jgi:two-component system OmpR family sensor kinase